MGGTALWLLLLWHWRCLSLVGVSGTGTPNVPQHGLILPLTVHGPRPDFSHIGTTKGGKTWLVFLKWSVSIDNILI